MAETKLKNNQAVKLTVGAYAYPSASTSCTNVTYTQITLGNEAYDIGGDFDTANSKFVAPVDGYYQINAAVNLSSVADGSRIICAVYKNGGEILNGQTTMGKATDNSSTIAGMFYLLAGDEIKLYCYQDSGTAQGTTTNASRTFLNVVLVGT